MGTGNPTRMLVAENYECVFQSRPEHGTLKILSEIFHPHEFAACNAGCKAVFTECQLDAVHGYIAEDQDIQHGGKQHDPQLPVMPDIFSDPPVCPVSGILIRNCQSLGLHAHMITFLSYRMWDVKNTSHNSVNLSFLKLIRIYFPR